MTVVLVVFVVVVDLACCFFIAAGVFFTFEMQCRLCFWTPDHPIQHVSLCFQDNYRLVNHKTYKTWVGDAFGGLRGDLRIFGVGFGWA